MDGRPEPAPLLPFLVSPSKGNYNHLVSRSSIHDDPKEQYDEEHNHCPFSEKQQYSLRKKLLLIMVAIPSWLLASAAVRSLGTHQSRQPSSVPNITHDQFGSILGPVVTANFPDPAILWDDGVSYAFATTNRGIGGPMIHIQMATSLDNQTWTLLTEDALPRVGAWETGMKVWAPDVVKVADGSFVMYYADATTWAPAHHCVGVARSKNITGPYIPTDQPWVCPDVHTLGGAIDPDGFLDTSTNRRWVTYKVDGNSNGNGGNCNNAIAPIKPTPIMLQEVSADGMTTIGAPVQILDRDQQDGPLIEAPSLHRSDEGIYFLFYSSNCFTTPLYDTAYATAPSITGPYTRAGRPLLISGDGPDLVGPGGLDVIQGGNMVAFHGHMTVDNSPAFKKETLAKSTQLKKPVADIHLPLTRGMYSANATFTGTQVTLVKTGGSIAGH